MTPLVYDRLPFFRFGSRCLPASLFYSAISCTIHFFRYLALQGSLRNPGDLRTCVTSNLSCVNEEKGLEKKKVLGRVFLCIFFACFSIVPFHFNEVGSFVDLRIVITTEYETLYSSMEF